MSANIVVTDVVVTLDPRDIETMGIRKRVSFPVITFGHASLQLYPNIGGTIGVPMPAIGAFGMKKAITRMFIQGDPARGYYYVYDPVNNTIRIYQVAADPGAPSIAEASGGTPAGSNSAPAFTGTPASPGTPSGTVDPSTHAFTGAAMGNFTPAGGVAAPAFTGSPLAAHTHVLTGASGAAAALVELPNATVVPVTTLQLMVIGA